MCRLDVCFVQLLPVEQWALSTSGTEFQAEALGEVPVPEMETETEQPSTLAAAGQNAKLSSVPPGGCSALVPGSLMIECLENTEKKSASLFPDIAFPSQRCLWPGGHKLH